MSVVARRPSLTPSHSRRSSLCATEPLIASTSRKSISGPSLAQALNKKLDSATMPSPSETPTTPGQQSIKRKLEEELGASFGITSASEIVLPTDPARRASIINLATAAAAAVLQGQDAQRRLSLQMEQQNKRQRTRFQQLGLLAEQARLARSGSISVDKAEPIPTAAEAQKPTIVLNASIDPLCKPESLSTPLVPLDTSTIGLPNPGLSSQHQQEWADTVSKEGFLKEAKMVANSYGRFYRFEQEWANKVLAFESSRSISCDNSSGSLLEHDVRRASDPLDNAYVDPQTAESTGGIKLEPSSRVATPLELSRAASRIQSRAQSPMSAALEQATTSQSTPAGSKRPSNAGPSQGLVTVLSNFAELLEARQQVCSGLEALADQAKELPLTTTSSKSAETTTAVATLSTSDSEESDTMSDCSDPELASVKQEEKREQVSMSIASII